MKPTFKNLLKSHYSSSDQRENFVDSWKLYEEIGYDYNSMVNQNPGYRNTCAIRVSLALIKENVSFEGRLRIKAGLHKGKMIEPGAKLLADQLRKSTDFGKPTIYTDPKNAAVQIGNKKGIIFFWKIVGYDGGHIDLISTTGRQQMCHSDCYFECKEIWFWEIA